jgi:hypothetical protein
LRKIAKGKYTKNITKIKKRELIDIVLKHNDHNNITDFDNLNIINNNINVHDHNEIINSNVNYTDNDINNNIHHHNKIINTNINYTDTNIHNNNNNNNIFQNLYDDILKNIHNNNNDNDHFINILEDITNRIGDDNNYKFDRMYTYIEKKFYDELLEKIIKKIKKKKYHYKDWIIKLIIYNYLMKNNIKTCKKIDTWKSRLKRNYKKNEFIMSDVNIRMLWDHFINYKK